MRKVILIISLFFIALPVFASAANGGNFDLDLVWSAKTLVPYDYPGKALPTALSRIEVYAIANVPNPKSMTYTWVIDDISSTHEGPELSAVGADKFTFFAYGMTDFEHELRVTVFDAITGINASASLDLKMVSPETILYYNSENGYSDIVPKSFNIRSGGETSFMVRNFYYNTPNINGLDFKWYMNNKPAENSNARADIIPINISSRTQAGAEIPIRLEISNKRMTNSVFDQSTARTTLFITK